MARSVTSLFLAGAMVYTAVVLLAAQPRGDVVLVPVIPNETVKAKQRPASTAQVVPGQSVILSVVRPEVPVANKKTAQSVVLSLVHPAPPVIMADETAPSLPPLPRPALRDFRQGDWAEVVGYTAVAFAAPSASAPVLAGYPVGQPFRVIGREGKFVRVQDLRSGQLGWIQETSLAHYTGYARSNRRPPIFLAAAVTPTSVEEIENSTMPEPEPQVAAALPQQPAIARKVSHAAPYALGPAGEPAAEAPKRGLFTRVAARQEGDGFSALMQRAFSGY